MSDRISPSVPQGVSPRYSPCSQKLQPRNTNRKLQRPPVWPPPAGSSPLHSPLLSLPFSVACALRALSPPLRPANAPPAAIAVAAVPPPYWHLSRLRGGTLYYLCPCLCRWAPCSALRAALLGRCPSEPGLRAGRMQRAHMLTCAKTDLANIA